MLGKRVVDVLNLNWKASRRLALACALVFAGASLHAQMFQDLYDFNCNTGGCNPVDYGYLTRGMDANLYGTTSGNPGTGTIFMVTPTPPVTYTDVYKFDGVTAADPLGGLTLANDNNFYGTTYRGGTHNLGTVFRFNPGPPSTFSVLYNFSTSAPSTPPVQAPDGNLYGITSGGQAYRVTLPAGTVKILPNPAPGDVNDPLFLASDANLYGVSRTGGSSGLGTVFRLSTTGVFTILHNFTGVGTDGAGPQGPLTQGSNGNLYGTTQSGGTDLGGIVFEMSLSGKSFKSLHSFNYLTDGGQPVAGLLAGPGGYFYGVCLVGGTDDYGTLFQTSNSGVINPLFDFTGTTGSVLGENATTTLMEHTNGTFYGLTSYNGGAFQAGTVYALTPPNPILSLIIEGPIFVLPGVPVTILGNNLTGAISVSFAGVQASFSPGSDTYLIAQVPSQAVDGLITVTLATGQQIESQQNIHILPKITNLDPSSGPVGTPVAIVGGGFLGTTKVTFGGVAAKFTVVTPALIQATVPTGAVTGKVGVRTPNGFATSKQVFTVN
jgi:uncharacterized repeat protein (TIGR03803 family)